MDSRTGMGLDDFLSEGSKRGAWLEDWRKKGEIDVWLHTKSRIYARYAHSFPFLESVEDKETRRIRKVLRWHKFGCLESIKVLESRFFRDKVTGEREVPPVVCPLCVFDELLRADERLPDDAVIFAIPGAMDFKGKPTPVSHVKGNMTGVWKTAESWKDKIDPRKTYLIAVVPEGQAGDGVQITEEASALGDALRAAIKHAMESKGAEAGNPALHPYAFRWRYHEKEVPARKYEVFPVEQIALAEEVRVLIVDEPPPDLSQFTKTGDPRVLRAYFDEALTPAAREVFDVDAIFAPALAAFPEGGGTERRERRAETPEQKRDAHRLPQAPVAGSASPGRAAPASTPSAAPTPTGRRRKVAKPAEPPRIRCDGPDGGPPCDAMLLPTDAKCPKCGVEYEVDAPAAAPAAAAPVAERAASPAPSAPAPVPEAAPESEWSEDEIPF